MKHGVVFGAGSIGRGFVGALLSSAGWHVTFVDVVVPLVERLNADGFYHQVIVDNSGERIVRISPVDGIELDAEAAVADALLRADLVATAVGAANLEPVARLIGGSILAREKAGAPPLDVLLCENLHHAPTVVRELIARHVGNEVAERVGLLSTSIGRMVPVPISAAEDPTAVRVEPYNLLPYDAQALRGEPPEVPGLIAVEEGFGLYEDRKLYVHNMGHCMLAYLGEQRGYYYVWQGVEDLELRSLARGAMVETATALAQVHGTPCGPLLEHVDDLLARFGNRGLADTIERVGRDPVRKMHEQDRLLGAYRLCLQADVTPSYVSVGVALGARKLSCEPGWDRGRVIRHLERHLFPGSPADGLRRDLLIALLAALDAGDDAAALMHLIDESSKSRGE